MELVRKRFEAEETACACHRISGRFEALNRDQYKPYPVNASMGKFCYTPEMNFDLEQIIKILDKNLYHNKLAKK